MSMIETKFSGALVENYFVGILDALSEKERDIIGRRIGLTGNPQTLQKIGDSYSITRERVRQIESVGIKKIGRIVKGNELFSIQETAQKILEMHGGLLIRDKLISAIISELKMKEEINTGIIEVILQADFEIQKSKPQLGVQTYFYFPRLSKKFILEVHKQALSILKKRGDVMEEASLYEGVRVSLNEKYEFISHVLIAAILDAFDDVVKGEEKYIALTKWRILNPLTLKDKAIYIMKKQKQPLHFVEIANAIANHFHEVVKTATIHNELIRNNEFVLIGRGIYVLKEWGYKAGTVIDVIIEVFRKAKKPLSSEEIIDRVLKVRQVKRSTIYMNLQKKRYVERVGRNQYQLREDVK